MHLAAFFLGIREGDPPLPPLLFTLPPRGRRPGEMVGPLRRDGGSGTGYYFYPGRCSYLSSLPFSQIDHATCFRWAGRWLRRPATPTFFFFHKGFSLLHQEVKEELSRSRSAGSFPRLYTPLSFFPSFILSLGCVLSSSKEQRFFHEEKGAAGA